MLRVELSPSTTKLHTTHKMDEVIEILGQQPGLNIYTQIAVLFAVEEDSSYPNIVNTLSSGLERLAGSFPWVAGQVVNEGAGDGNTGVYKIKPLKATPPLVIKDLRDTSSAPTMHALRQANFPVNMLDESIFAPRPTLPIDPALASEPQPVFIVQATFIKGGLVLTFLGHHQLMDGTGQAQIIDLLSKACRNEPFTEEEVATGNLPRQNIIPLLEHKVPASDVAPFLVTPPKGPPQEPAACRWAYFNFPSASLSALKALASESVTSGYITTDDALSAFIWQSVSRIRAPRLNAEEDVKFARAVNVRSFLNVPQTFPGLIQSMTNNSFSLKRLIDEPLGVVASALRSTVDPKALGYATRAFATVLDKTANKAGFSFTGTLELHRDIMLSSWVKMDLYEQEFGLGLGRPESVRRPQFTPVESLMYLLPKTPDGDITLVTCLRDEDMDKLRSDATFKKYATHIDNKP
ncbi:trichothecene 3-O-acetyltransferase [Colletotrichum truncatum]|uniref:Trichothecene 3-O-acetyltransferase n=1 Tax=Colletotrichum truncatum TaxID=5467 RepID=A0ACC3YUP3_COLTU|nr:trichothecene 3-O-acetyltransferase [Colletotrichum truncatum]KAF6785820.1 trichothecene 3-O-acetyltransferase [Colletotrichum truncatum]